MRTPTYRLGQQRLVVDRKIRLSELADRYEPMLVGLEGAEDLQPALVEILRAKLKTTWQSLPEPGDVVDLSVVHMGREAGAFQPYAQSEPYQAARDPVNLVFFANGGADRVAALFKSLDPPWIDSDIVRGTHRRAPLCAMRQVTWMDTPREGGDRGFVWSKYSLSPQGCDLKRTHVRLFEGAPDLSDDGWGNWCFGSVHEEDVLHGQLEHTVTDWDGAQRKVARAFLDALGDRCNAVAMRLQRPDEVMRGVRHDGLGSAIRLD